MADEADQVKQPAGTDENEELPSSNTDAPSSGRSTGPSTPDSAADVSTAESSSGASTLGSSTGTSTPGSAAGLSTPDSAADPSTPDSTADPSTAGSAAGPSTPDSAADVSTAKSSANTSTPESPSGAPLSGSATFGPPDVSAPSSQDGQSAVSAALSETAAAASSAKPATSGKSSKPRTRTSSKTSTGRRKKGQKADMNNCRIGFLGAGRIVDAIVKGLIKHTKVQSSRIFVASKSGRTLDNFKHEGCVVTKRSYDLFAKLDCDVVFIAVHGHVIRAMFKTGGSRPMALTTNYIPNQRHMLYLLSMVGGVPNSDIKKTLLNPEHPEKYKLEMHRIMLNASVAYGMGLGAIDIEPDSKKCSSIVRDLLTSFAKIEYISEGNMDAACALGGNGLAFAYYFISALSDGGFKMGLSKNTAVKLATKTLQSAAATLLETGKHATELRDQCTSPSGPAIYGIHVLDKKDAGSGIATAVEGAFKRIRELVEQVRN